MSTVHVSNKLSFLHGENSAAAGKSPERRQNPATEILGHATEVYISAKGKALSESDDRDADLTPAEAALAANERERADKHAKKVQAEEIEKRIRTDTDLTDEDRTKLQKRADELKRAGMTDEDKLSELYAKANELEKRVKDGTVTDREIEEPLSLYRQQIGQLKGTMREKSLRDLRLRGQAVQERADRDAEITKAQEKETAELEALRPGDLSALAALKEYQKTAAGKKNADRSGIVIPTNKNTNDT